MEIINNANITESQKQEAVDNMIALTDYCGERDGGGDSAGGKGIR